MTFRSKNNNGKFDIRNEWLLSCKWLRAGLGIAKYVRKNLTVTVKTIKQQQQENKINIKDF